MSARLDVIAARFNPAKWQAPDRHYDDWVRHMLDSGVRVTVCELQYDGEPFRCARPGIRHIGVRSNSICWSKENLLNIAYRSLPDATLICWSDSDIRYRDPNWPVRVLEALERDPLVQTWDTCLDLGPDGEVLRVRSSLAALSASGAVLRVKDGTPKWQTDRGELEHGHPGFSWACRRELLDRAGGFFEVSLMGAGDSHMGLSALGRAEASIRRATSPGFERRLLDWQDRILPLTGGRIGLVRGTIEHAFHGRRSDRSYIQRWDMFSEAAYDPETDIRYNQDGVIEWAGTKPRLQEAWHRHVLARNEDASTA